ncbi:MAG: SusC/RagA family TonB-linked outer membrane protein [Sphingobacteriaceae bacterium]|nr:MAG: SusC/RagA family TonB-linked outer membrane protein [Sphingobacteriaceae bacterium]
MKKLLLASLCILLLCVTQTFAQNRTVTGTVVSKEDGLPIPGASVTVVGSNIGTQTNADGKFSLSAPTSATSIQASFLGYTVLTAAIPASGVVTLSLESDTKQLSEVVVTALGISREVKSLGYATQQVSGEELTKAREVNVVNALAGKVAGVRVTSASGTLGGSSKIIIRGQSSFRDIQGGQPIFVIDGLPINNDVQQLATANSAVPQGTAGVDFGNRAGDVNPDDIESINVLKGAAATALYGARAKNGAIIITTKRGKKGSTVTLNSSVRFDNPLKLPSFQNEYAQGTKGQYSLGSTNGWGPKISEVQDLTFKNFLGQDVKLQAYPDNVKDFYNQGNTIINALSFEGGNETSDIRIGYTNTFQTGILPTERLKRNAFSVNAGKVISPKFDVRSTINYVSTQGYNRPFQSSNSSNVLTTIINALPRTVDVNQLKDNVVDPITGQQIVLTPGRTGNNPYWITQYNDNQSNNDRVYGNLVLNYKPISWLTVSNNFGTDLYNESRILRIRPGSVGTLQGSFFTANIYNRVINDDFMIRSTHQITPDFRLDAMVGANFFESTYSRISSDAQQLTVDQLYAFTNASAVTTTNASNQRRIIGYYGELDLSYKNFLYLTATGRNDNSSTLPVQNRSYFYPSVSTSFVFSELMDSKDILTYGKIRGSWANVGSDTEAYQTSFVYLPQSNIFGQYSLGPSFPFNGLLGFLQPTTIPNFDLKPQNQNSFEVGTDLRFFSDRVSLELTYYNTSTSNQIVTLALPQSTGFTGRVVNAGTIKNSGFEVTLGLIPVKTSDFKWNINANFAANKQKVVEIPAELTNGVTLDAGYSSFQVRAVNGQAMGLYGVGWEKDPDGNYVIDQATGLRVNKTNVRFGNMAPNWTLGIQNNFTYKGVNLSFLIDFRNGGVLYSGTTAALRANGLAEETLVNRGNIFIDKGSAKNSDGTYTPNIVPVLNMEDYWAQYSSSGATEANIFDASYIKLREVRLSYSLPAKLFANQKFVKGIDIGVEGRNLWIIKDNVPHIDPEVNLFSTASIGEGYEFNGVPSARSIGFNIRAKF